MAETKHAVITGTTSSATTNDTPMTSPPPADDPDQKTPIKILFRVNNNKSALEVANDHRTILIAITDSTPDMLLFDMHNNSIDLYDNVNNYQSKFE